MKPMDGFEQIDLRALMDPRSVDLYTFIANVKGFSTSRNDPAAAKILSACLELEKAGRIRRGVDDGNSILWFALDEHGKDLHPEENAKVAAVRSRRLIGPGKETPALKS